mmetsp:Transcript_15682/g.30631  ORF Transcript_15682/g.30631 Transcript_15682/m.30631 type:complete len:255 (+) Transcript_15682:246-1010(+)
MRFFASLAATRSFVAMSAAKLEIDPVYPGTAVARMTACRERARSLSPAELSEDWIDVRRKLLWAAGLRDITDAPPGMGYTGHAFNDDNHCDATCMLGEVAHNLNDSDDRVQGIAVNNKLGPGIEVASLPELGVGGSWSTCTNGCHLDPPRDVAHVQFRSRIAFKLVWCPDEYKSFVLVDDDGVFALGDPSALACSSPERTCELFRVTSLRSLCALLAHGTPTGALPPARARRSNFELVKGSKYAVEAVKHGGAA